MVHNYVQKDMNVLEMLPSLVCEIVYYCDLLFDFEHFRVLHWHNNAAWLNNYTIFIFDLSILDSQVERRVVEL